ncbi:MAG: hypothetical protein IJW25_02050, partial [Clostridia bacterium]|nr:hypothetical protein [Clostridia bacterium]
MFNKNKITLETRENKLEKIKKKSLRKTLFTTVMSMGVLLGCTGMLVGCGETGPKGDTGAQGPQGVAGADGSLWLTGTAAPLDTQGRDGDLYLNTTTYDIYLKSGLGWISIGNIQGGKGEQGNPGTPGVTPTVEINKDGYWVINGVATEQPAQGEAGATPTITIVDGNWYVNGEDTKVKAEAIDGTKGADGNTWAVGTTAPTQANTNDMFLNNTTWEVYKYNGTDWVSVGNIKGEQGEEGPQGEAGADGTTWFTGIAVSGTGNGIGVVVENAKVGDLYFNTNTYDMYVCLAENIWGWMCNIKGEQGVAGTTPTVEINNDGYWVINGVATEQPAQGEAGATPTITIVDGNWYVNGEDTKVKAEAI